PHRVVPSCPTRRSSDLGAVVDDGKGTHPHLAVRFSYSPLAKGQHNAQLNVDYNGSSRAQLPLYGEADFYATAALSATADGKPTRSEEHTSELQSRENLV